MTRVEVLINDGLAGYFFTEETIERLYALPSPAHFASVTGEWIAAGGVDLKANGPDAWYLGEVAVGKIDTVSENIDK